MGPWVVVMLYTLAVPSSKMVRLIWDMFVCCLFDLIVAKSFFAFLWCFSAWQEFRCDVRNILLSGVGIFLDREFHPSLE